MSGSGKTRGRMQLTVKAIDAFKPDVAPYRVPDTRAARLALRVAVSGLKTWDLVYRVQGARLRSNACPWAAMAILGPVSRRLAIALMS
jgi:hypothetical protein